MISYTHKVHPKARSLKLKIEAGGEVVVTTPRFVPKFLIEKFVSSNQAWIETAVAKVKQHAGRPDVLELFGEKYTLELCEDVDLKPGLTISGKKLLIKPAGSRTQVLSLTSPATKQTIERYLKATAEKYIVPRTHQLAKLMHVSFHTITLREQKSRWGSCSSQGNLNFNWRLVHYPPAIIDYVIIHELAHRTEMNHSAAFWEIVRQFDPEHAQHRGWLKRHGLTVH